MPLSQSPAAYNAGWTVTGGKRAEGKDTLTLQVLRARTAWSKTSCSWHRGTAKGVGGSLEAAFRSGRSWRREASCRGTLERCCLPHSSAARRGPRRAGRACRSLFQAAKPGTFEMCAGHRAIATRTAVLPTQSTRKGACSYAAHAHTWQMVSLQYLAQLCCQAPHNVPALGAH